MGSSPHTKPRVWCSLEASVPPPSSCCSAGAHTTAAEPRLRISAPPEKHRQLY